MTESFRPTEGSDEVMARLLAELEQAGNRDEVIRSFCERYPDRSQEFREIAELGRVLDRSAVPIDPPLPARLGDFRVVRKIGSGGMGVICEAIQEPLDRRVAVKIIRQGWASPASRERFLQEQRVLAQLHQTHIIPVFAAGEDGQMQYFAMPYIDGLSLNRLILNARERASSLAQDTMPTIAELVETARLSCTETATQPWSPAPSPEDLATAGTTDLRSDLPPPTLPAASSAASDETPRPLALSIDYFRSVARVMRDVAESVHHAHEHGIVHRDLKPSNIMVDRTGQSWLIDFGLARYVNGQRPAVSGPSGAEPQRHPEHTVGPIGTPGYMAPEQESAQPVGVWTDVWGLGVTLYELLTLNRAYPRERRADHADSGSGLRHVSPRRLVKNFPLRLGGHLRQGDFGPLQRIGTPRPRRLADDLKRWLQGEPTVARPARTLRRVALWRGATRRGVRQSSSACWHS